MLILLLTIRTFCENRRDLYYYYWLVTVCWMYLTTGHCKLALKLNLLTSAFWLKYYDI